jgi:hypothetical protein
MALENAISIEDYLKFGSPRRRTLTADEYLNRSPLTQTIQFLSGEGPALPPDVPSYASTEPAAHRPPPAPAALPKATAEVAGPPRPPQLRANTPTVVSGRPGGPPRSPQGLSQAVADTGGGTDFLSGLQVRRGDLQKQLEELNKPQDYGPLQQQMLDRSQMANSQMAAAALMGLAPSGMRGMQQAMLKGAEEYRAPMKIEGGTITPEGQVLLDPTYQNQKKIESIHKHLDALDKLELTARTEAEKAEIARERNQMWGMIAQMQAQNAYGMKMMAAALKQQGGGLTSWLGEDPATRQNVFMSKMGPVRLQPNGTMVLHTGGIGKPPETTAGEREAFVGLQGNIAEVSRITGTLKNYQKQQGDPNTMTMGLGRGAFERAVPLGAGPSIAAKWTPEILQSSREQLTHEINGFRLGRTGVTLTVNEREESNRYLPNEFDDLNATIRKAEGFTGLQQRVMDRHMRERGLGPGGYGQQRGPQGPGLPQGPQGAQGAQGPRDPMSYVPNAGR